MEQEISLLDLLAAAIRKGKQIIVFALICGLLFMGYAVLSAHLAQSKEEEAYTLAEKERQIRDLKKTIERAEQGINNERDYIRDSLFMQINPNNVYTTRINYMLTNLSIPLDGSVGMMENPTDYVMERIMARYLLEWNGTDLQELLTAPGFQNIEDRYLRELISVGDGGSGNLYIYVNGATEIESQKLAEAAEKVLLSLKNDVATESYGHSLVKVSTVTKQQISEGIRDRQNVHFDVLDAYVDAISVAQKDLLKLESEHSPTGFIKKFIIGCLTGGILSILWVMFCSMLRGNAESAEQVASQTGLKFLGSVYSGKTKDPFAQLASAITGETKWASDEEALSYLAKRTAMEGSEKLLVTTTGSYAANAGIEALLSALRSGGMQADFLPAIATSAEALSALQDADSVLFAVMRGKTKVPDVLAAIKLAEESGKSVAGYVMM